MKSTIQVWGTPMTSWKPPCPVAGEALQARLKETLHQAQEGAGQRIGTGLKTISGGLNCANLVVDPKESELG